MRRRNNKYIYPRPCPSLKARKLPLYRGFSSTNSLGVENDQDKLINEINGLEEKFYSLDRDVEEFTKEVDETEVYYEENNEQTELSKIIQKRESKKNDLIGTHEEASDQAQYNDHNTRQAKSFRLDLIEEATKKDIKTLNRIKSELHETDDAQEVASNLIDRLETQKAEASKLQSKWHESDLPPINPSSDFQDSSEIYRDDFTDYSDDID